MITVLVGVILIALATAMPATAQEGPRIRLGKEVKPLDGAILFCKRNSASCEPHEAERVSMSSARMVELVFVNLIVNAQMEYHEEPNGRDDWDEKASFSGDCEDFGLVKKRFLISLGWPPGSLHIVIVKRKADDDDKVRHAILIASTDQGDYVLDLLDKKDGVLRLWNPNEFNKVIMVWGADAKWYAPSEEPVVSVATQ